MLSSAAKATAPAKPRRRSTSAIDATSNPLTGGRTKGERGGFESSGFWERGDADFARHAGSSISTIVEPSAALWQSAGGAPQGLPETSPYFSRTRRPKESVHRLFGRVRCDDGLCNLRSVPVRKFTCRAQLLPVSRCPGIKFSSIAPPLLVSLPLIAPLLDTVPPSSWPLCWHVDMVHIRRLRALRTKRNIQNERQQNPLTQQHAVVLEVDVVHQQQPRAGDCRRKCCVTRRRRPAGCCIECRGRQRRVRRNDAAALQAEKE